MTRRSEPHRIGAGPTYREETDNAILGSACSSREEEKVAIENWNGAMRCWPSDGYDGAANVIAVHAYAVNEMEEELDRLYRDWRDSPDLEFRPRTRDPRFPSRPNAA